jgi:hypothetical protein
MVKKLMDLLIYVKSQALNERKQTNITPDVLREISQAVPAWLEVSVTREEAS